MRTTNFQFQETNKNQCLIELFFDKSLAFDLDDSGCNLNREVHRRDKSRDEISPLVCTPVKC